MNDTSSVTAAAAAWDGLHGSNTMDAATIVKLTRTLAIIPITLVLSFWQMRKAKKSGEVQGGTFDIKKIFPFFILFFILAFRGHYSLRTAGDGDSANQGAEQVFHYYGDGGDWI